jgi:ArsR family transcriptional regulator
MMRQQEIFRALSDPTRRQILKLLKKKSLGAGEIADKFPLTKGSLSHHFNALKSADLVRTERRGQHIVYSLNTTVFEDVMSLFIDLFGSKK